MATAIESSFDARVLASSGRALRKTKIEILQVNLGKLCNMTCTHCHVEAGPNKTRENMDRRTAGAVIEIMDRLGAHTLDLTGGAPELNPNFYTLVLEARKRGMHVLDRCNLTVFYYPNMEDLPAFLREQEVEIVASLPCYSRENVNAQRGKGAFDRSILALQWLNRLGYGLPGSNLALNLVFNPLGAKLAPSQQGLEEDYKERLLEDFGIRFHKLYTLNNMPITRFEKYLKALGQLEAYEELLLQNFNPATLEGLMCHNTLSVGWDGKLYDCDFNQMLDMGLPMNVFDAALERLLHRPILTGPHCFGCTAGSGSSCRGSLA